MSEGRRTLTTLVDGTGEKISAGNPLHIEYGPDSSNVGAFGRLRVCNPQTLFDSTLTYDKQSLLWNEKLTDTGTSTHLPNESSVLMSVVASGDKVERQSIEYFRYQPGKSQLIFMTFAMGDGDPNVRKRIGYFDSENGIFIETINGSAWVVRRSSVTGSVVDTRIAQDNWNLDTRGNLDLDSAQVLVIDLEWLGVGRVRTGFVEKGTIKYVHEFLHANAESTAYMTTAQLPCRLEIEATGLPSALTSMRGICATVISEGGRDNTSGFPFASRRTTLKSVAGADVPLLSIRPKAEFNSITNRVRVVLGDLGAFANSSVLLIDVVYDGVLTNASFSSVDGDSVMEEDVAATAITGGKVVATFYVPSTRQSSIQKGVNIQGNLSVSLDLDGANPTNVTLVATKLDATTDAGAFAMWQEYR